MVGDVGICAISGGTGSTELSTFLVILAHFFDGFNLFITPVLFDIFVLVLFNQSKTFDTPISVA